MLLQHMSNQPVQPCTLPPVFLTTFIKKCFPADYEDVDFDQALTALDYMRDLEIRRHKELEKAVRARGAHDGKVMALKKRSAKLDNLYAKALVGVRRWTLINELSMPQFNKCNCVAMLNTLYPLEEEDINEYLTAPVLLSQRQALWRYITGVEKNGAGILDSVLQTNGGWEHINETVYLYTRSALEMIQRAEDIARPTSYGSFESDTSAEVDSFILSPKQSFTSHDSARQIDSANDSSDSEVGKRSTLEKIFGGLAKLRHSASRSNVHSPDWNTSKRAFSNEWSSTHTELHA